MRKVSYLLSVITIACVCALIPSGKVEAHVDCTGSTKGYLDCEREKEEAAALAAIQAEKAAQAALTTQNNPGTPAAPAGPAKVVAAPAGILFIGDSRCVQMKEAVGGGGCSWIAQNGGRYEWYEATAVPRADAIVGKGTKVIICMGVNDTGDVAQYAALTNAKAAEWTARGAKVYYCSVNPVWENPYTSADEVNAFNAAMPGMLSGVRWIDSYSAIQGPGCKIVDGLHYDTNTYINLFNIIIGRL